MKKERIYWGALFILASIALIINKLGYFSDVNMFSIVATIFLVGIMIKSIMHVNFSGIFFPLAFICIIYDKQLGITELTPWTVLIAALLGTIGFSIIFHKPSKWNNKKINWDSDEFEIIDIEDESHVRLETSFASSIKYVNTDKFKQANLECSFGSMKVYFDNAILDEGKGIVKLEASFSVVELYIPKTWTVEDRSNVSFGGINEKNRNEGTPDNTLVIVGDISFSGVDIIYV